MIRRWLRGRLAPVSHVRFAGFGSRVGDKRGRLRIKQGTRLEVAFVVLHLKLSLGSCVLHLT